MRLRGVGAGSAGYLGEEERREGEISTGDSEAGGDRRAMGFYGMPIRGPTTAIGAMCTLLVSRK